MIDNNDKNFKDMLVKNPYNSLAELTTVITDIRAIKNPQDLFTLISISKYISDEEELVVVFEMYDKKLYFNTYINFEDKPSYEPWIECEVNLGNFKSIDELTEEMIYHFRSNHLFAIEEKIKHYGNENDK